MRTTLDKFIVNLKELKTKPLTITKEQVIDVFWSILLKMSLLTIMDTGQAKSALVEIFASRYGKNVFEAIEEEFYNIWGNFDRHWGWANVNYKDSMTGKFAEVNLSINDAGLYNQEISAREQTTGTYPSLIHPIFSGRNNKKYWQGHITWVKDNFDTLDDFKVAVNKMCDEIEKHLFK
jgi:hypothetical protein